MQGAEAIITEHGTHIHKNRIPKLYRHTELDASLRLARTRKESKILADLEKIGVLAPRLIEVQENTIIMTKIEGEKLRDTLAPKYCQQVGRTLAQLHEHNIIHGDLTTSNMILQPNGQVALIDFGLSSHSTRLEDRAVDLHLFLQALSSKHPEMVKDCWAEFLQGYQPSAQLTERFAQVEKRGRNKA